MRTWPWRDPLKSRLTVIHPPPGALDFSPPRTPTLPGAFSCPKGGRSLQNSALQVQKGPLRVGGRREGGEEVAAPAAALLPSRGRRVQFVSLTDNRCVQRLCRHPVSWHPVGLPRAQRLMSLGALWGLPLTLPTVSFLCLHLWGPEPPKSPLLNSKVPSTALNHPLPLPTPGLVHFHCPASPHLDSPKAQPKGASGMGHSSGLRRVPGKPRPCAVHSALCPTLTVKSLREGSSHAHSPPPRPQARVARRFLIFSPEKMLSFHVCLRSWPSPHPYRWESPPRC